MIIIMICSYISGRAWESDGSWQLRLHLGLFHICPVNELFNDDHDDDHYDDDDHDDHDHDVCDHDE